MEILCIGDLIAGRVLLVPLNALIVVIEITGTRCEHSLSHQQGYLGPGLIIDVPSILLHRGGLPLGVGSGKSASISSGPQLHLRRLQLPYSDLGQIRLGLKKPFRHTFTEQHGPAQQPGSRQGNHHQDDGHKRPCSLPDRQQHAYRHQQHAGDYSADEGHVPETVSRQQQLRRPLAPHQQIKEGWADGSQKQQQGQDQPKKGGKCGDHFSPGGLGALHGLRFFRLRDGPVCQKPLILLVQMEGSLDPIHTHQDQPPAAQSSCAQQIDQGIDAAINQKQDGTHPAFPQLNAKAQTHHQHDIQNHTIVLLQQAHNQRYRSAKIGDDPRSVDIGPVLFTGILCAKFSLRHSLHDSSPLFLIR